MKKTFRRSFFNKHHILYKNSYDYLAEVTGHLLCYKFNSTNGALEELKTEMIWIA
jgi:hypothetical protein